MSGGIATPPSLPQSPTPPVQPVVPQESPLTVLIQDRIRKTRRQVKGIDIIAVLLTLILGALVYLFAAALADHWLVRGGFGFWGRFLLWAILISAAGLYFVKYLWPALVLSINPVFAAQTIEQCKPTLKNSLINFLLLRGRQSNLAPVIYQALEQRAASDLKDVHIETAVDRRPVLRLSYLLLAAVGVICLYLAISPKSPITSARRILWPWSGVLAPTRVTIENVQPGDTAVFHGDFITVSADVMGLNQGETVLLHYSTADGEMLDQVIPMTEENSAYRRQAKLPPDTRGLQQDYSYFITAGDCKTATYHIQTQISPFIDVDMIDYHYPPYTGIPDRSVRRQGDVKAIEGTQITVHATANQPIERAEIDFSGTGMPGIRMDVRDRAATGQFTLRMLPEDPTRAEHDSYQLRFTDINHRKNRRPIRYNIEVFRDLEVQIVEPQKDETSLPLDGKLEISIRAEDLYFGLLRVAFRAELEKQSLKIPPILDAAPPEKPISGEFRGKYEFDPKKFNLKPGDRVAYWAEAEDNKEPSPNLTATGRKWIVILPPDNPQGKNDQQPHRAQHPDEKSSNDSSQTQKTNQQPNEQPQSDQSKGDQNQPQNLKQSKPGEKDKEQSKPGGKDGEQSKPGEKDEKGEKSDGNQKGEKNNEAEKGKKGSNGEKDGKSNEGMKGENGEKSDEGKNGEKGEKSNKGMKGEKGDQVKQDSQSDSRQQATDQSQTANQGESSQTGNKSASPDSGQNQRQPSGDQTGKAQEPIDPNTNPGDAIQAILKHRQEEQQKEQQKTQPGEQQQNNQQQSGEKQSGEKQSGEKQSGEKQAGEKQSGEKQSGEKQSGEKQSGEKQTGEKQSGEKQSGEKQAGEKQSGEKQSGEKQSGEKQSGEKQSGEKQSGEKQSGEKQSGEKQAGEKQAGEKQAGEKQSGEKQSGEKQSGEKQSGEKQSGEKQSGEKQSGEKQSGEKQSGEKQSGEKQSGEKQSGEKQSGEKQSGEKQSGEKQSGEKQAGEKQAGEKQSGEKQAGEKQSGEKQAGEKQAGEKQAGGEPSGNQLGHEPSASSPGNPTSGGGSGPTGENANQSEAQQSGADAINLDYARKQTTLALEHLEDQLAKDRPELLERLGWTREQAQRFIDRWQQLREAADEKGIRGEAAKKQLDDALKSLGLRPGTTVIKHGGTKTDQLRDLRDSGRFAPPQEWAEQFREYTRGVANQGKATADKDRETGK